MTGIVEMASIHKWKQDSHQNIGGLRENGEFHDDQGSIKNEKTDIPVWKRNLLRRSSVDDSRTNSAFNNNNLNNKEKSKDVSSSTRSSKFLSRERDTCTNSTQDIVKMGKNDLLRPSPDDTMNDTDSSGNVVSAHLKHVHSNPFFREYGGVIHPHGHIYDDLSTKGQNSTGSNAFDSESDVDREEYAPVSGFVSKLRKKFNVLSVQPDDEGSRPFQTRKFASVENLVEATRKQKSPIDKSPTFNYPSFTSFDTINHVKSKPKIVPKPSQVKASRKLSEGDSHKLQHRQNHHDHPDVGDLGIGRDDIIIIEHAKPPTTKKSKKETSVSEMDNIKVKSLKDDVLGDELPKPNTVSSFRSMFEKNVSSQKILPDTPKVKTASSAKNGKPLTVRKKEVNESPLPSPVNKSPVGKVADTDFPVSKESVAEVEKPSTDAIVKPSAMKERAKEPPRIMESPITRKKLQSHATSIFDSGVNIKPTVSDPVVKKTIPAEKDRQSEETNAINTTEVGTTKVQVNRNKFQAKQSEPKSERNFKDSKSDIQSNENTTEKLVENKQNIVKSDSSENSNKKKKLPERVEIFDSSLLASSRKTETKKADAPKERLNLNNQAPDKPKVAPEKKEVFDSSSVVPASVSSHGKRKKAPPRPQPVAKADEDKQKNNAVNTTEDIVKSELVERQNEKNKSINQSVSIAQEDIVKVKPTITPRVENVSVIKVNSETHKVATNSLPPEAEPKIPMTSRTEFKPPPLNLEQNDNQTEPITNNFSPIDTNDLSPTRGLPSVIRNRLKKKSKDLDKEEKNADVEEEESDEDDSKNVLIKPSQLLNSPFVNGSCNSPVPKKRTKNTAKPINENSGESKDSTKEKSSPPRNNVPASNIEDIIRGKKSSPSAVFDSSNIVPVAKPRVHGVPPLDLADLISDRRNHQYQEGYIPTKIEPCKIIFIGAGVKVQSSPMKKTGSKVKHKIQFDESSSTTHEYPTEDWALEEYLREHPHETEEAAKQQEEESRQQEATLQLLDFDGEESSDDPTPSTPRDKESTIRSNTPIGIGSGELSSYKSKIQTEEYQFGMILQEPEPVIEVTQEPQPDPDDMNLLPADEDDLHNFTDVSTSDMLF